MKGKPQELDYQRQSLQPLRRSRIMTYAGLISPVIIIPVIRELFWQLPSWYVSTFGHPASVEDYNRQYIAVNSLLFTCFNFFVLFIALCLLLFTLLLLRDGFREKLRWLTPHWMWFVVASWICVAYYLLTQLGD
jgi:hypothetical protein